jgi:protein-arginine deiminase
MFRPIRGRWPLKNDKAGRLDLELAIETCEFAGPGRSREIEISFRFETTSGNLILKRDASCSVAPFLLSCGLDPVEAVHVVRTKSSERFVSDLKPLVEAAGARLLAFENAAVPDHDVWIQDATEIGFVTDGEKTMSIALHGNRGRELDALFAKSFLGRDAAVVHPGRFRGRSAEWIDWFGNLEVSPPLEGRDRDYPRGRIYAGTQGARAMHPDVIGFLEGQGAQAPVLWLDTSWLVIGHVDEVVSWVPSDTGNSFRMLVPSPRLALDILRKAEKDAPGCLLNRGTKRPDSQKDEFCDAPVAEVLADRALIADQDLVQKKIDDVRRALQAELGVSDADIIEIPVLFNSWPGRYAGRFGALTTNMVNSLLVGKTFIVPDPHGPLVGGTDVLLQAVKDRLEPLGCRVAAIDNFYPYHRYGGEVHCGTNATRLPARPR